MRPVFHSITDASKVAFYNLVNHLTDWNFDIIDVQVYTRHLESLGARPIPRSKFLELIELSLKVPTRKGKWSFTKEQSGN